MRLSELDGYTEFLEKEETGPSRRGYGDPRDLRAKYYMLDFKGWKRRLLELPLDIWHASEKYAAHTIDTWEPRERQPGEPEIPGDLLFPDVELDLEEDRCPEPPNRHEAMEVFKTIYAPGGTRRSTDGPAFPWRKQASFRNAIGQSAYPHRRSRIASVPMDIDEAPSVPPIPLIHSGATTNSRSRAGTELAAEAHPQNLVDRTPPCLEGETTRNMSPHPHHPRRGQCERREGSALQLYSDVSQRLEDLSSRMKVTYIDSLWMFRGTRISYNTAIYWSIPPNGSQDAILGKLLPRKQEHLPHPRTRRLNTAYASQSAFKHTQCTVSGQAQKRCQSWNRLLPRQTRQCATSSQHRALIGLGGPASWIARKFGGADMVAKFTNGPSLLVSWHNKGGNDSEDPRPLHVSYDIITGPELALVFGHVIVKDAKGTVKERWLFPTEEILREYCHHWNGEWTEGCEKIFERLYKEVKGPNPKAGSSQWREYLRWNNRGTGAPQHGHLEDEYFEEGLRKFERAFGRSWHKRPLDFLVVPERFEL
ncbi:hypothetical protein Hypma_000076 [Hypsizygus marmoreus]|uniref:Uncharacterized protein n=1 Tax=Hypsizygus marmoreus TaxID=39966 RepID=A0A369KGV3_HYPMA|nr:hypothetical protein Hypma_000076 [Hypsizygus marmoreus]